MVTNHLKVINLRQQCSVPPYIRTTQRGRHNARKRQLDRIRVLHLHSTPLSPPPDNGVAIARSHAAIQPETRRFTRRIRGIRIHPAPLLLAVEIPQLQRAEAE